MKSALTHNLDIVASKAVKWISMGAVIEATGDGKLTLNSPVELEMFVDTVALQVEKVLRGQKVDLLPISKDILQNLR